MTETTRDIQLLMRDIADLMKPPEIRLHDMTTLSLLSRIVILLGEINDRLTGDGK